LSAKLGLSKAQTVREAIRQLAYHFSGEEDPLAQLIGGLDDPGVPSDLSTRHDEYAVEPSRVRRVAERKQRKEKKV
ncbi:MAG: hypothetical protein OEZ54_10010, partial [Gemmatimonadota bacterium]|nr:hypothetical protein [Gemmatimonadota bacterium]